MKNYVKWNWGKGIVLVYALFVTGMLYLVFQSKQQKIDLVVEDYYQQELKFQDQIDASKRANSLGEQPRIEAQQDKYFLVIPGAENQPVKGDLLAYCSADKKRDQKMELHETSTGRWQLPLAGLLPGKYIFKINWQQAGLSYYSELNYDK
jgi:nitrogen fixation protein FixH